MRFEADEIDDIQCVLLCLRVPGYTLNKARKLDEYDRDLLLHMALVEDEIEQRRYSKFWSGMFQALFKR